MLSGEPAFRRETAVETLHAVLKEPAPRLSGVDAGAAGPVLQRVLDLCLAKAPEERPQSIDQVAETLERLSIGLQWTAEQARRCWLDIPSEESSSSSDVGLAVAI